MDIGFWYLSVAAGCVLAFFATAFLWGLSQAIVEELRAWARFPGSHPAVRRYRISLFVWRGCFLLAGLVLFCWYQIGLFHGYMATALVVLLGVGWTVRWLAIRRILSDSSADGDGPEQLRSAAPAYLKATTAPGSTAPIEDAQRPDLSTAAGLQKRGELLRGFGALFMGLAILTCIMGLFRRTFPDALPWHLLRSVRPPVQPWQSLTWIAGVFLVGLRMVVLGNRADASPPPS